MPAAPVAMTYRTGSGHVGALICPEGRVRVADPRWTTDGSCMPWAGFCAPGPLACPASGRRRREKYPRSRPRLKRPGVWAALLAAVSDEPDWAW